MPATDQLSSQDRYTIVPRVLIFVTRGEFILLLKGSPTKRLWANLYNGIGGHIEKGEDILSAAKREFFEETGLKLTDPWLCAVITIDTNTPIGIGMYVFRGSASDGELKPSSEGETKWIPYDQIQTLQTVEDLSILIPRIMEINKEDQPLSIQYSYDNNKKLVVHINE